MFGNTHGRYRGHGWTEADERARNAPDRHGDADCWARQYFFAFIFAQVLFGIGAAMRSGADTALMYDSLDTHNQAERYSRVEGVSFAFC